MTRVPKRIPLVRSLARAIDPRDMLPAAQEGYRYAEVCTTYGGVRQRWLVGSSVEAERRDREALQKLVANERAKIEREMHWLESQEFP